jgi:ubiquinone/menaquinone biosynthesis C-methylase UbiE
MDTSGHEKLVGSFYDDYWSAIAWWKDADETLSIHYGLYDKGIKTRKEALYNMNDYVAKLIRIEKNKTMSILDAGCGVGGTSIYLAKKYPNINFTGISIASDQVRLAKTFAKERGVQNTSFIKKSYLKTGFPDNSFDGVFALESSSYAQKHSSFIDEMVRILKPGGRLVVIDSFLKVDCLNPIMQKIYDEFCLGFGYANLPYLKNYTSYLREHGFAEIVIEDISKNVGRSVFMYSIFVFPFFLSNVIKRLLKLGRYKFLDDSVSYSRGSTIIAGILGLSGVIGYFGTTAVKK